MPGTLKRKACLSRMIAPRLAILALWLILGCGGGGGGGGTAAPPDESGLVREVQTIFSQEYFNPAAVRARSREKQVQQYVDSYRCPADIYTEYFDSQEVSSMSNDLETPENLIVRTYGTGGTRTQYVCFEKFVEGTADHVIQAIEANIDLGYSRLVLDLRVNSGGWVDEVERLANYFISPAVGPVPLVSVDGPASERLTMLPLATPGGRTETTFDSASMMVLTSGLTASAAEILVAGLVHFDEATQAGSSTFGKNRVTKMFTNSTRGDGCYMTAGIVWHADQLDLLGQPLPGQADREGVGIAPEPRFMSTNPFELAATSFGFFEPDPLTTDWSFSSIALANLYIPSFWRDQVYMAAGLTPAKRLLWLPEFMGVPGPDPMPLP